jgi:GPH family glycoside/pentoside/hexuronide:cation symporter
MNMLMESKIKNSHKLSLQTKLFYGIGDVGNATNNSAFQFFLMIFFTDVVLVAPAIASSALLVAKVWDAFMDPLFGWICDKTDSRFGKRSVYLIIGAAPLAISIIFVWFIPIGLSSTASFIWITLSFMFFGTLWTITNVPYYALSAELTKDYDERSSLTAFRMIMAVPAYILGAAITPLIANSFGNKHTGYHMVGIFYGILGAIVLWVAVAGIREKKSSGTNTSAHINLSKEFISVFENRPFVLLLLAFSISNLAFTLTRTFIAYFLTYQMGMESQVPVVMFLMLSSVVAALFPWKMISDRWNKGPAYAMGLLIGALAVGSCFFLPNHSSWIIYVVTIIAGVGFATTWVFPWAMLPDVVDYDHAHTGIYRCGLYFGIWGLITKISEALGLAISGWVLQLSGYIPNVVQSPSSIMGIKLFFGPVPAVLFLVSIPFLIWYPITRKSHSEIKNKTQPKLVEMYAP